jgi:transcriptional regulator with XRE-family HTH domain
VTDTNAMTIDELHAFAHELTRKTSWNMGLSGKPIPADTEHAMGQELFEQLLVERGEPQGVVERMQRQRLSTGLTADELGAAAGISGRAWIRLENGDNPTAGQALGLSWAFGVDIDTVIGWLQADPERMTLEEATEGAKRRLIARAAGVDEDVARKLGY